MEACHFHPQRQRRSECTHCHAGLCTTCSRSVRVCPVCKKPKLKSLAAETAPFNEPAALRAERERLSNRKKDRTRRFSKGKASRLRRVLIGLGLLSVLGALLVFDYRQFVAFTEAAGKRAKAVRALNSNGSDFQEVMDRIDRGQSSEKDVADTEALMKQIESGTARNSMQGALVQLRERIAKAQQASGSTPQMRAILERLQAAAAGKADTSSGR